MYACMCDYMRLTYMPEVAWDIDTIYLSQNCKDLCLNDFDHLNPRDLTPIIASLEHNTFFNQLSANSLKIKLLPRQDAQQTSEIKQKNTEALTKAIVQVMKKTSINKLVLVDCNLKQEFAHGLNTALLTNTKCCLTHLNLSNNSIEDRGVQALSDRLAKLPDGLTVLKLAKTNITSKGVSFMFKSFNENDRMSNLLKVLDLSYASFKDGDLSDFKHFLATPNVLTHLDISFTGLPLDELFNALYRGCLLKMSHLNLAGNTFTTKKVKPIPIPPSIKQFFSSAMELKVIGLSGNKIPPDVVKEIMLAIGMNKSIVDVDLDLSSNELKAAGCLMVESAIGNVTNIRSLNISDNDLNDGLVSFLDWVGTNKTLKVLDISKNLNKTKSVEKTMEALVKLIQEEDLSLENLSIADCHLNYETIVVINALGSNTSLTSIDLSGNNMRDLGAKMLAKALMINSKLTFVNCDRNNITSDGYRELANALERNYTLKNFPMPVHDVHNARQDMSKFESPLNRIQQLLQRNHSSRKYMEDQAFLLQQGFLYTTAHQMVDKMVVQIQDKAAELDSQVDSDAVNVIVDEGKEYIKDADNSKQLLARMQDVALLSSLEVVEEKLQSMASDVQETVQSRLKETLNSMLDCAEDQCTTVMNKSDIKSELLQAAEDRAVLPDRFMKDVLDQVTADISNKISEVHLAMASQISDTVVGDILANLEDCYKKLSDQVEKVPTLRKSPVSRNSTASGGKFMEDDNYDVTKTDEQPPVKTTQAPVKEDKPRRTKRSIRPKSQFIPHDKPDMGGVEPITEAEIDIPPLVQSVIPPKPATQIKTINDIGTGGEITPLASITKDRPRRPKRTRPTRPTVQPPSEPIQEDSQAFKIQTVDAFYTPTVVPEEHRNEVPKQKKESKEEKGEHKKKQESKPKKPFFNIFSRKRDKSPNPKKKEDPKDKKSKQDDKKKRKGSKDVQPVAAPVEEKPTPPPAETKPPASPAPVPSSPPPAEDTPSPVHAVEKKPMKPPTGGMGFGMMLGQADLDKHLSKRKSSSSILNAKDETDKAVKKEDKPKVDKVEEEVVDKPADKDKTDVVVAEKQNKEPAKDEVSKEIEKEPEQVEPKDKSDNIFDANAEENNSVNKVEEVSTKDEHKIVETTDETESTSVDEVISVQENNMETKEVKDKDVKDEIKKSSDFIGKEENSIDSTPISPINKVNLEENLLSESNDDEKPSLMEESIVNTSEHDVESPKELLDNKDNTKHVQNIEDNDTTEEDVKEEIKVDEIKKDEIKEEMKEKEIKNDKIEENIEQVEEESPKQVTTEVSKETDDVKEVVNDTDGAKKEIKETLPDVNGTNNTSLPEIEIEKPLSPKPKPLSPKPVSPPGPRPRKSLDLKTNYDTTYNELPSPTKQKSPVKPTPTPRPKSTQPANRPGPPPITKPRPASISKPPPSIKPRPKKPGGSLRAVTEPSNAETNGTSNGVSSPEVSAKPQVKSRPKSIETSPSKASPEVADKNLSPK
ncbi:capping protein, Arp2/3 and myosin-I linker protein 3-like isoform X2 [Antedon mediterranea]|uniref:capping protein, Arp2/3 and myosin-I linker protein 3-like isoform X2 n=1 Tax=Antedon mediterranea TaxID=105859 RepID=UPI003AF5C46A